MSVLDREDAKRDLGIDVATFDTQVQSTIDSAEAVITKRVGPLASTTTTSIVDGRGRSLILPVTPVVSVTSVTGNWGDVVTVSDLTVVPPGVLEYNTSGLASAGYFYFPSRYYTVVYQSGRATCPADLLEAVRKLVRHLWQDQRGPTRVGPPVPGPGDRIVGAGYLLPYAVEELIAPYIQTGFA